MMATDVAQKVTESFADTYSHFKEFQHNPEYRKFWEKCVESTRNRDFLICVIFCNDVYAIPPVKTFLTYYRDDFIKLTCNEKAKLDIYIKRAIGAFWGMVFKYVLGYSEQKSVSVSMNEYFLVKTASVYSGKPNTVVIE